MSKPILVLGSTGSIGTQTLDLVRRPGSGLRVAGLAAGSSWKALLEQVREFEPDFVSLRDPEAAAALRSELPASVHLFAGGAGPAQAGGVDSAEEDPLVQLIAATDFECCVHGVVGAAGLQASVAVLEKGRTLALANKESLVIAGAKLMALAKEHGAEIIPVDSEHSALFQCMRGERLDRVRRILLTGSGGPFRTTPLAEISHAQPAAALAHPNWDMGPRISIGSATMINKALEVIEVHHLFGLERERIEVVIHPQSVVHSMVEFIDGSVIGQMGPPDMRGPIHFALHHPDRAPAQLAGFDWKTFRKLEFEAPDPERFPAIELGFRCVDEGSDSGCVLNAADEVAVDAYLNGRIAFGDICRLNREALDARPGLDADLGQLMEADAWARRTTTERIAMKAIV